MDKHKIIIFGATSAIAEHCARLWSRDKAVDLTLIGRDMARLERCAADIRTRSPDSTVRSLVVDLLDPAAIQQAVDDTATRQPADIVLVAQGSLPDQDQCQEQLQACRYALEVNALSPVLCAEASARQMQKANHGTLVIIGSVAGDRGRRSNYVYGAAKELVARYAEGLQHRFAGTPVRVVLVKPGPTDTPMTAHMKARGAKLAPVAQVAREIVTAARQGKAVIYTPAKWALIMWVIRRLPAVVFNKMNV